MTTDRSLLIRYLSRFYGEIEDENGYSSIRWDIASVFALTLAVVYWMCLFGIMHDHPEFGYTPLKVSLLSMVFGFFLSSFSDLKSKDKRGWNLILGTVAFPGSLMVLALTHVCAAGWVLGKGLLKLRDGLLFLQEMLSGGLVKKWKDRQKQKRLEQDSKLKAIADKVRVSGGGYRMAHAACDECGQVLPENENDGREVRSAG